MSEELKIFTKHSNHKENVHRYLWVFAEDDEDDIDISDLFK